MIARYTGLSLALAIGLAVAIVPRGDGGGPEAPITIDLMGSDPADTIPAAEPFLERYLDVEAGEVDRARSIGELRRGLEASRAAQPDAAEAAFRRAAALHPGIADWALALTADARAAAGDTSAVRELLAATEPGLAAAWGWRAEVRALRAAGLLTEAAARAEEAAEAQEPESRKAAAWVTAADVRLLAGDTAAARQAFRTAMELAPGATAAVDAARKLSSLPRLSPEEHLAVGRIYLRHGNLNRALAGLDAFAASAAGTAEERARARLDAGKALFNAQRYPDAERRLAGLAADRGVPAAIAAEALFYVGRSQFRHGRREQGMVTFRQTADRFPAEAASAEALFTLADLEHDGGRTAIAREHYRRALAMEAGAGQAALAGIRLGGLAFLDGDYQGALQVFVSLAERPVQALARQQAGYWAAKSKLRVGMVTEAHERLRQVWELDPLSYYGFRAAELLGGPPAAVPLAPAPGNGAAVEAEVRAGLDRVEILRELGLDAAVALEQERLRAHLTAREGGLYTLAEEFNRRGDTFAGILLGRDIHRREGAWNNRLLRIVYPFPYRDLVEQAARAHGLDPFLVAGLIRQESMWNAGISSPVGAVGLMQIMPGTARGLARQAGMNGFQPAWLTRPDVNLRLGTLYLAQLLDRYNGRTVDALAAYNAGPTRIARWREYPEYSYAELFAERIPFAETRNYVRVVQQNARIYAALYGGAGFDAGSGE